MTAAPTLDCASYTHARRHPLVLGKIGGWSPPIQLSMAQVAILVGSYVGLLWSWALWAQGPGPLNVIVLAAGPWLPTWALRAVRIEGRDPLRCAVGLLGYLSAPRHGRLHGRAVTHPRPSRQHGRRFVTDTA